MKISFVFRSLVTANGLSVARTQRKGKQELHKTMACLFIKINFLCDPNYSHVLASLLGNIVVLHISTQCGTWYKILKYIKVSKTNLQLEGCLTVHLPHEIK